MAAESLFYFYFYSCFLFLVDGAEQWWVAAKMVVT
jgi:hypothetical protein